MKASGAQRVAGAARGRPRADESDGKSDLRRFASTVAFARRRAWKTRTGLSTPVAAQAAALLDAMGQQLRGGEVREPVVLVAVRPTVARKIAPIARGLELHHGLTVHGHIPSLGRAVHEHVCSEDERRAELSILHARNAASHGPFRRGTETRRDPDAADGHRRETLEDGQRRGQRDEVYGLQGQGFGPRLGGMLLAAARASLGSLPPTPSAPMVTEVEAKLGTVHRPETLIGRLQPAQDASSREVMRAPFVVPPPFGTLLLTPTARHFVPVFVPRYVVVEVHHPPVSYDDAGPAEGWTAPGDTQHHDAPAGILGPPASPAAGSDGHGDPGGGCVEFFIGDEEDEADVQEQEEEAARVDHEHEETPSTAWADCERQLRRLKRGKGRGGPPAGVAAPAS